MRYFLAFILSLCLSGPAFADTFCEMEGPHNCHEQIEDQLTAQTRNTIHTIQLTQDPHPFKTQNDEILAAAARRNSVASNQAANMPSAPAPNHWWN